MLLYYVVMLCCIMYLLCITLLGLFTCTSSFDIIGAMKPLSYFLLTSLSDPIARTADDTREPLSIPVDSAHYILQIYSYSGDLLEKISLFDIV